MGPRWGDQGHQDDQIPIEQVPYILFPNNSDILRLNWMLLI